MATFKNTFQDAKGRDWKIAINIGTVERVMADVGVDLMQPEIGDPPLITQLGTDELLLARVIASLISDQFEAKNTTPADVVESFDGKACLDATAIFYAELRSFFHARGRTDRATMIDKQIQLLELGVPAVTERLQGLDVKAVVAEAMADGPTSGDLPANSD